MSKAAMEMALKALERWQENVYINPHTLAKETISAIAALDEAIKQAKREALLEAAEVHIGYEPEFDMYESNPMIWKAYLTRKAKELE